MKRVLQFAVLAMVVLGLFAIAQPSPSFAGGEERVMVEFALGRGAAVRAALQRAGGNIHHQFDNLNVFAVTLPSAAVEGLSRNPNVVSIEEDVLRYPMAETIPWGVDAVQAPQMWTAGVTGDGVTDDGVVVCIIDSGYYAGHADLGANVTGEGDWNNDTCGHGTHVAGTISAVRDNDLGVVGVSPDVSFFIVKVFDGVDCGWTYSSDLIAASQVCANNGADIISMSLGGARQNRREQRQFDALYSQGILSIAAAGNDGNTAYSYPASYSSVVSVAAVDVENAIADFSQQNDQVELAAPGVGVLSTVPWVGADIFTVDGVTYDAAHIENAAYGVAPGTLVNGGLCDSTGSWSGEVVLCQRGNIDFYDKVMNVQNSGGAAAVIYNNEPGNFLGTLGEGASSTIVAISISQEDGQFLVANHLSSSSLIDSSISIPDSGYEAWNGTSMATPHVSAVAALLWSADTSLTNVDIRDAMAQAAFDLGVDGRDNAYGYGLVQAYDAYTFLGGDVISPPVAAFSATCSLLTCDFDASGSSDADGVIASYAWDFGDGGTSALDPVSHAYAAAGTYPVTLTVTDDDGATDSVTQGLTVSVTTLDISVQDISLSIKIAGPNISAVAIVTIEDQDHNLVSDATVTGEWSGIYNASPVSGVTAADGTVVFQTPKTRDSDVTFFTFTVHSILKDGVSYTAGDFSTEFLP